MKNKIFPIISLIIAFTLVFASFCFAEKVKVVEGVIQDVIYNSIKVKGNYYDISGVPLLDASGQGVAKDLLKPGKRVEIFFKNDRITSVVIHGYLVD